MKLIDIDEMPHLCLFALTDLLPGVELRYSYGDGDFIWRTKVRMYFLLSVFAQGTRNCEMCYAELLNVDPMLLQLDLAAVQSSVHQPLRFVLKLISMIVLKFKPNVNAHILF